MTDVAELLQGYTRRGSEKAFTEIVHRYIDLVYSTALRKVNGDTYLAEDVAQMVFTDLARKAKSLPAGVVLGGWLHHHTCFLAANAVRNERRRQTREQKAVAMDVTPPPADEYWNDLAPLLDDALERLSVVDRDAIVLRFFEDKSLGELARVLSISEDAAQKRVSRAVERLREFFAKRGVTVGAGGLAAAISANAVHAAPVGLATTISSAVVVTGTAVVATTTTATITKAIAMTALQKTLITATIAVTVGTGFYQAHQASALRSQVQMLLQQEAGQIRLWQSERDDLTNQLAAVQVENAQLKSNQNTSELLNLRREVAMLRQNTNEPEKSSQGSLGAGKQGSLAFPTNFVSTASLKFAGYATPEASLQSTLWAKSTGNEKAWLAGICAEEAEGARSLYVRGKTDEERSQFLIDQTKNILGGRILSEIPVADDEVIVQQEAQFQWNGATNAFVSMEVMKKIDGEWKLFDEYNDNGLFRKAP